MGRGSNVIGPLAFNRTTKTYRSIAPEVFVLPGTYVPDDVSDATIKIKKIRFPSGTVLPDGKYRWVDVSVREFGNGNPPTNATQLVVEATLEFKPSKKASGSKPVTTTPLLGDLGITIDWNDAGGTDPYGLLEATKMLYPWPY